MSETDGQDRARPRVTYLQRPRPQLFSFVIFGQISFTLDTPRRAMASASASCQATRGVSGYAQARVSSAPVTKTGPRFVVSRGAFSGGRGKWKRNSSRCRVIDVDHPTDRPTVSGRHAPEPHDGRVLVLGATRATFTAAIYCARNLMRPVLFERTSVSGRTMDDEAGDTEIDESVTRAMRAQAAKNGAHSRVDLVIDVDFAEYPYRVMTSDAVSSVTKNLFTKTLILSERCAASLGVDVKSDENNENGTTEYPGVFVALGSGFESGVAAEQWHGPVENSREAEAGSGGSSPIGTAFAARANKVRAAVISFDSDGGDVNKFVEPVTFLSSPAPSQDFDANSIKHVGSDALRLLYQGVGLGAGGTNEPERDDDEKGNNFKVALVAFFSSEGCTPCARLRPLLSSVIDEYGTHVRLVMLDMDTDKEMADALMVTGTPDVRVYLVEGKGGMNGEDEKSTDKNAKEMSQKTTSCTRVATIVGAKTKGAYRDVLDEVLGEDKRLNGPRRKFS